MLSETAEKNTVHIVTGYTDMRKGIDGLAEIIQGKLQLDPYSKALFLFCGKRAKANKIKGLLWDGDGFVLLYKCLDNGKYRFLRTETEAQRLSQQQIRWLLEGLEIEQKTAIKQGKTGGALY